MKALVHFPRACFLAVPLALALVAASCGDSSPPTGGTIDCATIGKTFKACGGDEKGTWKLTGVCLSPTPLVTNHLGTTCKATGFSGNVTPSGTVVLDGTNIKDDTTIITQIAVTVPRSCLDDSATATCADKKSTEAQVTCVDAASDACKCNVVQTSMNEGKAIPYTVANNAIVSGPGNDEAPFCIEGTRMIVAVKDAGETMYLIATRQ